LSQIILLHNTLLKILNCDMLISRVQTTTLPEPDASGSVSKRRVRFRFKPPISAPPQTRRRLQLRRDSPLLHTLSPARTSRRPAAPNHAEKLPQEEHRGGRGRPLRRRGQPTVPSPSFSPLLLHQPFSLMCRSLSSQRCPGGNQVHAEAPGEEAGHPRRPSRPFHQRVLRAGTRAWLGICRR
jgi:hypothetical protein